VIDARGFQGDTPCGVDPFDSGKAITLYIGAATFTTTTPWVLPNKSRLIGTGRGDPGGLNSVVQAHSSLFPVDTPVISMCTSAPCFAVQVENLTIDCNFVAGCVGGYNAYAEEQSWFRKVLVTYNEGVGIWIDGAPGNVPTYGNQNSGPYSDLEVNSGAAAIAGTKCVYVRYVPAWRGLDGITCNADGYTTIPDEAIVLEAMAPGHLSNVHIEHYLTGIVLGSLSAGVSDITAINVQTGPETTTSVKITAAGTDGKQNITLASVQASQTGANVLVDSCNSVTLSATTAGLGFYATGYGSCGAQTIYTTRKDIGVNIQTSLNVLKNVSVPGTLNNDGSVSLGLGGNMLVKRHDSDVPQDLNVTDSNGLLIQTKDMTEGRVGGGLLLVGGGVSNDASIAQTGAGYTGDGGTNTARAGGAAATTYNAGTVEFLTKSGLTPGNTFTFNSALRLLPSGIAIWNATGGVAFASLGTPQSGAWVYCTDCTNASNPCVGGGTGAFAKRLNGAWDCR
jgi:hypothetical protein